MPDAAYDGFAAVCYVCVLFCEVESCLNLS